LKLSENSNFTMQMRQAMRTFYSAMIGLAVLFTMSRDLPATTISEIEGTTEVKNNRISTAQGISASNFTLGVTPVVQQPAGWAMASIQGHGGGNDVDFYAFASGNGSAVFDVDGAAPGFDSLISLFNSSATLIAQDDDSPVELGSSTGSDSFLGAISLSAGTYYIAVSKYGNGPKLATGTQFSATHFQRPIDGLDGGYAVLHATAGDDFVQGNTSAAGAGGTAYILNISLSAVPEPSALALLAIAGVVVAAYARRHRAKGR
jgi:hypothetical protein